jgi:hypothetical protein
MFALVLIKNAFQNTILAYDTRQKNLHVHETHRHKIICKK